MANRRGEIQVFSTSFLDVLACTLGGVLLLLLMNMDSSDKRARSYAAARDGLSQQIRNAQTALADAQWTLASATDAKEALESAQAALIGLQGPMGGVVFIFDTSGSMSSTGRFDDYRQLLKDWVTHLPMEQFNVVRFSSEIEPFPSSKLADASEDNRKRACTFIDGFAADGGTDTSRALKKAFALSDVDTIVLMSDGRPSTSVDEIHADLARWNSSGSVTINCVAMGDYFGKEYAEFLQKIAHDHGGMFIGR